MKRTKSVWSEEKQCFEDVAVEESKPEPKPEPVTEGPQESPKPPSHVCPYCGADPLRVKMSTFGLPPLVWALISCENCRKPIPAQPVGQMR